MAERYREDLRREIPEIDAVLGTGELPQIVNAIGSGASPGTARLNGREATVVPLTFHRPGARDHASGGGTPDIAADARLRRPTYIYDADTPRLLATPGHYAYIKIAEGCDYKCAFCIIPTLRGAYRSRPSDSIVTEARRLASQGVRELLLVSQDTTFYGVDRNERGALAKLLQELNRIDGLEWIRLLYLYPTTIDEATLEAIAVNEKVCKYIDLPLQHASDPVLRRMKRPGTRRGYDTLLRRIRDRVPSVALRTTFIVGFPGETDDDVDALAGFMTDHGFDHVGVFTYSHEEGTTAYHMADNVPPTVKGARRRRLMSLQKKLVRVRQRGRIGQRVRVLVDGPSPDHDLVLKGRLASQAPDIDPSAFLTDCDPSRYRPGDFVDVEIVGSRDYDLIVRPLVGIS
jgi:ribosomal protein S12 methylthiotransferase